MMIIQRSHAICVMAFAALLLASCAGPKAAFNVNREDNIAPSRVDFGNTSENAESYSWDFGDGTTSQDSSPVHRYLRSGNYTVTLRAIKGKKQDEKQQDLEVKAPSKCLVDIATDYGNMVVELYDDTPLHRDNFLKLAEEGFYDGLLFHRVINGFMIQGGDPESKDADASKMLGMGGPGYQIDAEFDESHVHVKGALAAARTGGPSNPQKRSSGSQFYIVQGSEVGDQVLDMIEARQGFNYSPEQREMYRELGGTPHLDMEYTVFGRVVEGLNVIDSIASQQTGRSDRPVENISMKVTVVK